MHWPKTFTMNYVFLCIIIWVVLNLLGLNDLVALRAGFWTERTMGEGLFLNEHLVVPTLLTPISSALLHSNFGHLAGNMLFLMLFGTVVERRLGAGRTALLTIIGAMGAGLGFAIVHVFGDALMVGASGAISAIIGAAIWLNISPGSRRIGQLSAHYSQILLLIGIYVVYEVLMWVNSGFPNVAISAHIAGFITGLLVIRPIAGKRPAH